MKIETELLTRGVLIVKVKRMSDSYARCGILWVLIMTMLSSCICAVYVLSDDSSENGGHDHQGDTWYHGNALPAIGGHKEHHRHRHHNPGAGHLHKGHQDTYALLDLSPVQRFGGNETAPDHFKILYTEGDSMLVGARNYVYNISMQSLAVNDKIVWNADNSAVNMCRLKSFNSEECQNYVRVIVRDDDNNLIICGTNAYKPLCRIYSHDVYSGYRQESEMMGIAKCPYSPNQNSTALFTDGRMFTATISDINGRDPLIYSQPMRTEQHDSQWLNDPNFVSSFSTQDKVYFFFRETAVEYINCGKTVYSRVGRVCKEDQGGERALRNTWTSFFKARLNCSVPGEFPFYFDEIQSTSVLDAGNYMPTHDRQNRTKMIYGVFTTPVNSISGSAVCAFRFSDIEGSFDGPFKEQATAHSSWLPVNEMETPVPHPAKCTNESKYISDQTLNFIKSHPLMDQAVPAYGGRPLLVQASFSFQFTQITVDWQVLASDQKFYDILFLGTSDGRVVKAINTGADSDVDTTIIEDMQVFENKQPVVNLYIYRKTHNNEFVEKLVVVSRDEIKSVSLHRCHLRTTCSGCVALRDPYCSWTGGSCVASNTGIQNIATGNEYNCLFEEGHDLSEELQPTFPEPTEQPPAPCSCPPSNTIGVLAGQPSTTEMNRITFSLSNDVDDYNENIHLLDDNDIPPIPESPNRQTADMEVGASTQAMFGYTPQTLAIAIVLSIVLALSIGFLLGYWVSNYRHTHDSQLPYITRKLEQGKNLNIHNRTENYTQPPEKQLNVVFNPVRGTSSKLPNGSVETKVQPQKVKKVYL